MSCVNRNVFAGKKVKAPRYGTHSPVVPGAGAADDEASDSCVDDVADTGVPQDVPAYTCSVHVVPSPSESINVSVTETTASISVVAAEKGCPLYRPKRMRNACIHRPPTRDSMSLADLTRQWA